MWPEMHSNWHTSISLNNQVIFGTQPCCNKKVIFCQTKRYISTPILTSLTLIFDFADVSINAQFHLRERLAPWSLPTTRSSSKSHLFPTRIIGTWKQRAVMCQALTLDTSLVLSQVLTLRSVLPLARHTSLPGRPIHIEHYLDIFVKHSATLQIMHKIISAQISTNAYSRIHTAE